MQEVKFGETCPVCGYEHRMALPHQCPPLWGVTLDDPKGIDCEAWVPIYALSQQDAAELYVQRSDRARREFTNYAVVAVAPWDRTADPGERSIFEVRGSRRPYYRALPIS